MNCVKKEKYQQLLHTTSTYGHIDYGNKHFRAYESDNDRSKSIKRTKGSKTQGNATHEPCQNEVRFATVVSPIPDFDKYMEERERNQVSSKVATCS